MAAKVPNLLVIGGNGFVGSTVCRKAVQRGWNVTSISQSGRPWSSPSGHTPAWVDKVDWKAGDVFDRAALDKVMPNSTAVVSTLGILLESDYKKQGSLSPLGLIRGIVDHALGSKGNPLNPKRKTYDKFNRDAALAAFRAFAESRSMCDTDASSPFVYLSAEDVFRPFVPARYVETKREAERTIWNEVAASKGVGQVAQEGGVQGVKHARAIRPLFIRPSLIYHPHISPLTTLPATLLEASAHIQSALPTPLRASTAFPPTPSSNGQLPSALSSLASLLTVPPIHVDAIGESICRAIEDESMVGVLDVAGMRGLLGFDTWFDQERKAQREAGAA